MLVLFGIEVWDLESSLLMGKDDSNVAVNSNTGNSKSDSVASDSSSTDRSRYVIVCVCVCVLHSHIKLRCLNFSFLPCCLVGPEILAATVYQRGLARVLDLYPFRC